MARFRLMTPIAGGPPGWPYQRFKTGTTVADSTGNAQAGDVVWAALCAVPTPGAMVPLDAAAQALLPAGTPIYPGGVYSSNAFGSGLDAGS
jgi:hypothetical protein